MHRRSASAQVRSTSGDDHFDLTWGGSVLERLVRETEGVDVMIVDV